MRKHSLDGSGQESQASSGFEGAFSEACTKYRVVRGQIYVGREERMTPKTGSAIDQNTARYHSPALEQFPVDCRTQSAYSRYYSQVAPIEEEK